MAFAHIFDIGVALTLAFFVLRGGMRGLTGEIVSLLGLVVSAFVGWTFAQPLSVIVLHYFPDWNATMTELGCAVVIFIAVSLAFSALGKMLRFIIRMASLTILDHVLGAAAGVLRAFVIVILIYGTVSMFPIIPGAWMEDSIAMQGASTVWPTVFQVLINSGMIDPSWLTPRTGIF